MQSLGNLNIFLKVSQTGSFTDAAKALDMSPSAASRAVARLEKSLQVKLFHRTTRSLSLTPEGEKLRRGAETLLGDWKAIEADLTNVKTVPSGPLKVSIPSALGLNLFVPLLVEFQSLYPQIQVDVSFEDRKVDLADDGFDLVVRTGELADSANHIARKLFEFEVHLCASPEYLQNSPPIHKAANIANHRTIRFRNRSTGRLFNWPPELLANDPGASLIFDDGNAVAQAAVKGAGLAMLPTWLCAPYLRKGSLVRMDVPFTYPSPPVWLVYLNRKYVSSRIQSLVDFLVTNRGRIVEQLEF